MNSAFRARWLASLEVISQVLFTSEQPKKNKMAFVGILSQLKLLSGPLVIQLVWYILKHLSVGESDGYLPPLRWIIVNYNPCGVKGNHQIYICHILFCCYGNFSHQWLAVFVLLTSYLPVNFSAKSCDRMIKIFTATPADRLMFDSVRHHTSKLSKCKFSLIITYYFFQTACENLTTRSYHTVLCFTARLVYSP